MRCVRKYLLLLTGVGIVIFGIVILLYIKRSELHCVSILGDRYASYVRDTEVAFPTKEELTDYRYNMLVCLYEMYTRTLQYHCKRFRRFGEIPRKGWYICLDFLKPAPHNCSLVSANSAFDESEFVKHVQEHCICEFHKLLIPNDFEVENIKKTKIDLLTFSIMKNDDMVSLKKILDAYAFNVHQLLIEIHSGSLMHSSAGVRDLISVFQDLHWRNFRLVWFDIPYTCVYLFNNRACKCISLSFVHISSDLEGNQEIKNSKYLLLPSSQDIWEKLSRVELARSVYNEYISSVQFHCKHVVRMGKINDGGWDVCHDFMLKSHMKSPCIVYSFGIENDFSFDDDISNTYGCRVYAFDPSMGVEDYQRSEKVYFFNKGLHNHKRVIKKGRMYWNMDSLDGIRKQLNHTQKPIKILKMDIERAEWIVLKQIIDTGQLSNVEQFLVELHAIGDKEKLLLLRSLYDIGFRIFWFHKNPLGSYYHRKAHRSSANEISFINVFYLRQCGLL